MAPRCRLLLHQSQGRRSRPRRAGARERAQKLHSVPVIRVSFLSWGLRADPRTTSVSVHVTARTPRWRCPSPGDVLSPATSGPRVTSRVLSCGQGSPPSCCAGPPGGRRGAVLFWTAAISSVLGRRQPGAGRDGVATQAWGPAWRGSRVSWGQDKNPGQSRPRWAWCLLTHHFAAAIMRPLLYATARSWCFSPRFIFFYNNSPRTVLFITLLL